MYHIYIYSNLHRNMFSIVGKMRASNFSICKYSDFLDIRFFSFFSCILTNFVMSFICIFRDIQGDQLYMAMCFWYPVKSTFDEELEQHHHVYLVRVGDDIYTVDTGSTELTSKICSDYALYRLPTSASTYSHALYNSSTNRRTSWQ